MVCSKTPNLRIRDPYCRPKCHYTLLQYVRSCHTADSILDKTFYARVMNGMLKPDVLLSEDQNGFRKGRSCIDAIFTLKMIIEKRGQFNLEAHLAFLQILKKAFANVDRSLLCGIVERRGFPVKLFKILHRLHYQPAVVLN